MDTVKHNAITACGPCARARDRTSTDAEGLVV